MMLLLILVLVLLVAAVGGWLPDTRDPDYTLRPRSTGSRGGSTGATGPNPRPR